MNIDPTLYSRALPDDNLAAKLHPRVARWFQEAYQDFTLAQRLCLPAILEGESVLLSSPTGTGKTLAGFLAIIDWLVRQAPAAGSIYAIYISPLRSLTYDIQKNLNRPIGEMGLSEHIRVGLRTGDTSARDRARLKARPPHILLTTPESLAILLCQPAWHAALAACRFVVVDELHSVAENKRGTHLSVSLERLERLTGRALCRIGLSATISPMETMAAYLVGTRRTCVLAEARTERRAIIEVFSPVRRNPYPPAGQSANRVMSELAALVRASRAVLIFANTREGAENVGIRLKEALPKLAAKIEVHHSSLDRDLRLKVEDRLKNGELCAAVCSSSLEMGVDIGSIDLVVMISAPKGISRTLQRIGRSGHALDRISHGILVATNVTDLLECTVTARLAREGRLEEVHVQENSADVLAQHVMGLALEEPGITEEAVWNIIRQAWPYRRLERTDFERVLEYLEGGGRSLAQAYTEALGKIRREQGALFVASPRAARDYLLNIGTISTRGLVDVAMGRKRLGAVEEGFIKRLKAGDVFVLGGRVVRLLEAGYMMAKVEAADGERPNVPKWMISGRMPLTVNLATEIGRLRGTIDDVLASGKAAAAEFLVEEWEMSLANAQAVVAQFELQRRHSRVPREGFVVVEHYREPSGAQPLSHFFFHSLAGRRVNDALARIVARRVAGMAGGNAMVTTDDYGFLLTLRRSQELSLSQWRTCFARDGAEEQLRLALKESEMVRWQFNEVAQTGLMVPRQLPGKDRALRQLRFSSEILFRVLEQHEPDHPLLVEAYRQASTLFLDLPGACDWMEKAARPDWRWELVATPAVSPFGFSLYASNMKESMMFEDPDEAIERLYQQFYGPVAKE